ncbi:MAG: hypothetical protein A3J48_03070 [Candidatus Doudnabacteria bacterium RIFCSPHIGHO2_02_FULL_46_11]|uniref:Response regulatory domain-containing protein n=1 Tax=Candidatus Doudnabacteria bacterium RIFCSPHIGHO2_02_FULL_46_11 TaxID=1817832 RepID=A0A1F5P5H3_9BACT|nr:MAG: hypothetical protein A3J48_03070 [Candidatus Doudnabacteria bacterium RIFCSPHIGHO2_02_FULL_46_11]
MPDKSNYVALVVEDERPLAQVIQKKMEKSGFETVLARSVDQALGYMEDLPKIDVIWLDHYLIGEGTGLDFVEKLKHNTKWKAIPIFVVSNTATQAKVHSYIDLGVTKYYTKSDARLDQIVTEINKVLQKNG